MAVTFRRVPSEFATVQDAVNAANAADVIVIEAAYAASEAVTVNKEFLLFEGSGSGVIDLTLAPGILDVDLTGLQTINVVGNASGNKINGNDGGNTLAGGAGGDTMTGGGGIDALSYVGSTAVIVDLSSNTATGGDATGDVFSGFENVVGSAFSDILNGSQEANRIEGGDGDDIINGGLGPDTLIGGAGNDTLSYVGSAAVIVDLSSNTATGGSATGDVISGFENIAGSAFGDLLNGSQEANRIDGGDGDDIINGGFGPDTLIGGAGNDTLSYVGSAAVIVDLSSNTATGGSATGDVISGFENVAGSDFGDLLNGTQGANRIEGGDGDDIINGGLGPDTLIGGAGNDTLNYVGSSAVIIDLSSNTATGGEAAGDVISGFENIVGSAFGDLLNGSHADNRIDGGGGDDVIKGSLGADTLIGGDGNDTVSYAGSGAGVTIDLTANTASGGEASGDSISGFENIVGSAHNDVLTGNAAVNIIDGGNGADRIDGKAGADIMRGGTGNDTYLVDNAGDVIEEGLLGGTRDFVYAKVDYTLAAGQHIEFLRGNAGATGLKLTGNEFANFIIGGTGVDTLIGGAGDDSLEGGAGADDMSGGVGNDTYYVDQAGDLVFENGGEGSDTVVSYVNYTLAPGQEIETLKGTGAAASLTLTGNEFTNSIYGRNNASDVLIGGGGGDALSGESGDDILDGGAGIDTIVGGLGADVFILQPLNANRDQIRDFVVADDQVQISAALFGAGLAPGSLTGLQFVSNSNGLASNGGDATTRFIYHAASGNLFFDADGAGGAAGVVIANFTTKPLLTIADFDVV